MPRIEIYVTTTCPYCRSARALLDKKQVPYDLIDVGADRARRAEMTQRAKGRLTVPQIFIDGRGIGGSDELHALDRAGKLDAMLGL